MLPSIQQDHHSAKSVQSSNTEGHATEEGGHGEHEVERYPVTTVDFSRVETPFIIGIWILFASIAKIGKLIDNIKYVICQISKAWKCKHNHITFAFI